MALPSFLCIGATKAGTTWLHEQLDVHPGVGMPVVKELHFFSSLHIPNERKWAEKTVTNAMEREQRRARRLAVSGAGDRQMVRYVRQLLAEPIFTDIWYRQCFDRPDRRGRLYGEITPAYAELPAEGIDRVCELLPGVRIIHLVRHPLDRALSHLRMAVSRRGTETTEQDLMALMEKNPHLVSRGAYEIQIPLWRTRIPPERLMLVPFGRVRTEPLALMWDIEKFLGIQRFEGYPVAKRINTTKSIDIPDAVVEGLRVKVAPSVDFLEREFGAEFLAATR